MRKDLIELSAQFRDYIGKSADDKKSTVGGFNQELDRMRVEAETKDEKVQEYEVALRDYMIKVSRQRGGTVFVCVWKRKARDFPRNRHCRFACVTLRRNEESVRVDGGYVLPFV